MTYKVNAIREELCSLKDGESFEAVMTINEVCLAMNTLGLDDRDFEIEKTSDSLRVTCHFKDSYKNSEKALATIGLLSVVLFFVVTSLVEFL